MLAFSCWEQSHVRVALMTGSAPLRLSVPSSINMYLRDYQRDGVAFFFRQYAQNQGGILGDDMVQPLSPPLWHCLSTPIWKKGERNCLGEHCLLNESCHTGNPTARQQASKQAR